ncbi:hypothetical protein FB567DRAFT_466673 [Paraphoma chrysanthemicola]|uniref:Chromo domain-containing protein n=1 Tax=Paraphoma chrysanthemicola TaxID=798071 RepID=A0A8K0RA91_9PLEO|nr:hypothetical protein FB567DRAFT_466673 [Paraphoma chrysanthemicola]
MAQAELDYDTDTISLTSTVESDAGEDKVYDIDELLSEGLGEDRQGKKVKKYLVKWEGYGMHRGTWEPEDHLIGTGLLEDWDKLKARNGERAFKKLCDRNTAAFESACKHEKAAHELRQRKRAKKRSKRRAKPLANPEDDSEEDVPLIQQRRTIQKKTVPRAGVSTSQEDYYDLFVGSQDQDPLGPPSTQDQQEIRSTSKQSPIGRKAPLEQSSTDETEENDHSSSNDLTDDSLLGELAETSKRAPRKTKTGVKSRIGPNLGNSILSPKSRRRQNDVPPARSELALPGPSTSTKKRPNQTPKLPRTTASSTVPTSEGQASAAPTATKPTAVSSTSRKGEAPGSNSSSRVTAKIPSSIQPPTTTATAKQNSEKSTASTAIKKSGTASISSIKMVNKPKEPARAWQNSEKLYGRLKYRRQAELRSRIEGTPDPSVLQFVGPVPPYIPKPRPPRPDDNPYGRREAGTRRIQESDDEQSRCKDIDAEPERDWEADKAPLVCPHWRLSNNCPYGPAKCNYLHRNQDKFGRDLPIGEINGSLPPKYRKPPLTCLYWLTDKAGCRNTDAECAYAHKNTGWIPKNFINREEPFKIDATVIPISEQSASKGSVTSLDPTVLKSLMPRDLPKNGNPPLTCPYWLLNPNGCNKADEVCKYAHKNTGWMPQDEQHLNTPMQIDPNQLPAKRTTAPRPRPASVPGPIASKVNEPPAPRTSGSREMRRTKILSSELTCWFWTQQKCKKSADQCIYQHHDTGIVADPPPSYITCRYWLENNCHSTAEECKYRHYHTGIISGQPHPTIKFASMVNVEMQRGDDGPPEIQISNTISDNIPEESRPQQAPVISDSASIDSQPDSMQLPTEPPLVDSSCSEVKLAIAQALKVDFTDMFVWGMNESGAVMMDRRALLLYHPEDHSEELEVLTRWMMMHHVEVGSVWSAGCWDYFRQQIAKGGSGVVVAHPDFEYFTELPGFGQLLRQQIRVWSLGVQEGFDYDPAAAAPNSAPDLGQDCIEIFPAGGFIYITDDVFNKKPQQALKIMKLFFARIDKLRQFDGPLSPWQEVDDACLLWRICVRPELMEHLFRTCEDHKAELESGDPDIVAVAELYAVLSDTNYIEQDSPVQPLSAFSDKYPVMSERRTIAEEEPLDYFNTLSRSQEEADLHMIRYYAGLQVDMRRDYRHFFVIHTEPFATCVRQWKQEIQTIADVLTPEQCVAELAKEESDASQRPVFDFCERYMSKLETGQVMTTTAEQANKGHTPPAADSQISIEDGEIRNTQQSLEDGEIYPTQSEA